jgi:ArsR family transcriptional regulator
VQILLAIGEDEACVCHLETLLGQRQPYISQHLMALRKAKILITRRDGRFVFYRVRDPKILDMVKKAGEIIGMPDIIEDFGKKIQDSQVCECPQCEPALVLT